MSEMFKTINDRSDVARADAERESRQETLAALNRKIWYRKRKAATRSLLIRAAISVTIILLLWLAAGFNLIVWGLAWPLQVGVMLWFVIWFGAWLQFMFGDRGLLK